jgi:hypothetical protein
MEDLGATSNKNYAKLNPDGRARVYRVAAQSTDTPFTTSADVSVDAVPNTNTVTTSLDGLRWLDLYDYYNLYKKVSPSVSSNIIGTRTKTTTSVTAPFGVGDPAGSRPYAIGTKGLAWSNTNTTGQFSHGVLAPIFLGLRWDVALSSRKGTVDPSKYVLQVHYYPMLVLYNPYAVSVKSSNFRCSRSPHTSGSVTTSIIVGGTTYTTQLNNSNSNFRIILSTLVADTSDLAPGEIRIYGLNADRHIGMAAGTTAGAGTTTGFVSGSSVYNNSMGYACRFTSVPSTDTVVTVIGSSNPQFDGLTSVGYSQYYSQYTDFLQSDAAWAVIPELTDATVTLSSSTNRGNSANFGPNDTCDAAVSANVCGPVSFSTAAATNAKFK